MPRWSSKPEADTGEEVDNTEYRRLLRRKVALLTGYMVMQEELEKDIAEITGEVYAVPQNRYTGPRKLLPPASPAQHGLPNQPQLEDPRQAQFRQRKSEKMKQMWVLRKAAGLGKSGKLPVAQPKQEAEPEQKRGRGRPPKHQPQAVAAHPVPTAIEVSRKRPSPPMIGFGTNTEFLYEYAASHDNVLHIPSAKKAAESNPRHNNLAVGGRMSVAVAEMKAKGFLVNSGNGREGLYRLTSTAIAVYNRERQPVVPPKHMEPSARHTAQGD